MFAEFLPMLHPAGAAPDNFARRSGNASVIMVALRANQKATQYTLRVVPGGLPLIGVFIDVATFTLFSLCQKEIIEANDIADVPLIGQQIVEYWLCPAFFSLGRGYPILKKKISNPAQAHTGKVLLIDSSDNGCFFGIYNNEAIR